MMHFQKLDAYQCAIQFLALAVSVRSTAVRGHAELIGQLLRAAQSVPLNIAEGAGRLSEADARRHYGIARGSAMECAAAVDTLRVLEVLDEATHRRANELRSRIASMLTRMSGVGSGGGA